MDSGDSGQPGQPVTRPPVDTSQGRDSVTLQLLVLKGILVMEKLLKLSGVTLIHVKVQELKLFPMLGYRYFSQNIQMYLHLTLLVPLDR